MARPRGNTVTGHDGAFSSSAALSSPPEIKLKLLIRLYLYHGTPSGTPAAIGDRIALELHHLAAIPLGCDDREQNHEQNPLLAPSTPHDGTKSKLLIYQTSPGGVVLTKDGLIVFKRSRLHR